MAVTGDDLMPRVVGEPRRWAALHCFGTYVLLIELHAWLEDLVGGLAAEQLELAREAARRIGLYALYVRAIARDGLPEDNAGDVFWDPFAGIDPALVTGVLRAVRAVSAASTVDEAKAGVDPVRGVVADVVAELGFLREPPSIRTPEGLFPALRLTRTMLPMNRAAHLPLVLPETWTASP